MRICFCHPVLNDYEPPIRSFFEVLCHTVSVAAKLLAIKEDMEFVELTFTAATRCNLEEELSEADIFVFAGHCDSEGQNLAGREKSICVDMCNAGLLKGKKVYLICCHAAGRLAREIVKHCSPFCLAFDDKVYLMARKQEPVLVRCLVEGISAMIQEQDGVQVWRRTIEKHKFWIESIMERYSDDEEWLLAAAALDWNMEHLNIVTKTGVKKGVSIMRKFDNPGPLTERQIYRGMTRLRDWINRIGDRANHPGLVSGGNEDLSPAQILRILEERIEAGDWGHNDVAERYLVQMATTGVEPAEE